MSRKIWFPQVLNRYTTDEQVMGGYMLVSQGTDKVPIVAVFGWTPSDDTCNCYIAEIREDINDVVEGSDVPGSFRLCHMAYDHEAVDTAYTHQDAIDLANEYQGGEYDCIQDVIEEDYSSILGDHPDWVIYQGTIDVAVSNFEDAWYTIEHLIVMWANQQD